MPEPNQASTVSEIVRQEWVRLGHPPDLAQIVSRMRSITPDDVADACVADAEERWSRGISARYEDYLRSLPAHANDGTVCRAVLMVECSRRSHEDTESLRRELLTRMPDRAAEIDEVIGLIELMRTASESPREASIAPGTMLGKYKLVEWLGAGSFGEVWNAWDRVLERYVALKLLPTRGPAQEAVATLDRVLAEAQAAAALDHENIVKVHDAGRFEESDRCYIDCQLAGDPDPTEQDRKRVRIAQTLSARVTAADGTVDPMSPKAAAALMLGVCHGVAAAHARGIVHRDIKPSNILVTESGRPLVTDFGLSAHVLPAPKPGADPAGTTVSFVSSTGRITGTPSFMSPEQARGERATPASDIYALGATLRYLLTGKLPFLPSGRHSADGRWDIIEQVRRREIRPLLEEKPVLHADLASVCDMAMAAEPSSRYISAQQMAEDLKAFLAHRPLTARPPGAIRAFRLWCRRNAAVATVAGAALAIGAAGTWKYITSVGAQRDRAVSAEVLAVKRYEQAQDALTTSEAVNGFLHSVLASPQARNHGVNVTVIEAIRGASRDVERQFKNRPIVEAKVRMTLARTFRGLSELKEARLHATRALEIRSQHLGPNDPESLESEREIAMIERFEGRPKQAEEHGSRVLARLLEVVGEGSLEAAEAMGDVAILKRWAGKVPEAITLLEKSIDTRRRLQGEDHPKTLIDRVRLAQMIMMQDRYDDALFIAKEAYQIQSRVLGDDHIDTIATMNDISAYYGLKKDYATSVDWGIRSLDAASKLLPVGHRSLYIVSRSNADTLGNELKRPEEAIALFQPHFDAYITRVGAADPTVSEGRMILGGLLGELGRFEDAEQHLLAALDVLTKRDGKFGDWPQAVNLKLLKLYKSWNKPERVAEIQRYLEDFKAARKAGGK